MKLPSIPSRPNLISQLLINQQGFDIDFGEPCLIMARQQAECLPLRAVTLREHIYQLNQRFDITPYLVRMKFIKRFQGFLKFIFGEQSECWTEFPFDTLQDNFEIGSGLSTPASKNG